MSFWAGFGLGVLAGLAFCLVCFVWWTFTEMRDVGQYEAPTEDPKR